MSTIEIFRIPDGPGYIETRKPYCGCVFPLAPASLVAQIREKNFCELDVPAPSGYAVCFADVLTGLRANGQADWADSLAGRDRHPELVFFPADCARLVKKM